MNITVFGNGDCISTVHEGFGATDFTAPLYYNEDEATVRVNQTLPFLSYNLTRALTREEQLDFSGFKPDGSSSDGIEPSCSLFKETSSPDAKGNPLKGNQCYNLQHGPANVSIPPVPTPLIRQLLIVDIQCIHLFKRQ